MKKRLFIPLLLLFIVSPVLVFSQQNGGVRFRLIPGVVIPVGGAADRYSIGFSADIEGDFYMPFAPIMFVSAGIGYEQSTNVITNSGLSLISAGVGTGLSISPLSRFVIRASAGGGYYVGLYENQTGDSLFAGGGVNISFQFSPSFSLGVRGAYRHYFTGSDAFFQGVQTSLELSFNPSGARGRSKIEYIDIDFEQIFPVFHAYYAKNPVGTVTIRNGENAPIENVRVSFFAKEYMANPTTSMLIESIPRNGRQTVPLFALFGKDILKLTEGTEASAEIIIEYSLGEIDMSSRESCTMAVERRNAMTWIDDRRAASFVTANDPAVLRFAKPVAAAVREQPATSLNDNFRYAFAVFQALSEYGMGYVADPSTPYQDLSENRYSVDFLQFPNETLTYRSGDCDDLSIMYAALLQSINIDAAFVTVPGHIFTAFALDLPPSEGRKLFSNPDNLIFMDDNTWIPVEITMFKDGFIKAWLYAADEWRNNEVGGDTGFFPVRDAWSTYKPVDSPFDDADISIPETERVMLSYKDELESFIRNDIAERKEKLEELIRRSDNSPRQINRLGVLYARYGLMEDAVTTFERAALQDFVPAIINLGSLYLYSGDYTSSLEYFSRADRLSSDKPEVILGLARANYELENYGSVKSDYSRLSELSPDLAGKYAYLVSATDSTSRAGFGTERRTPLWSEE